MAALVASLSGCYSMEPTFGTMPPAGTPVAFDVNDVGRVALGGSMGPEIAQVEGTLVSKDTSNLLLAVTQVHFLKGGWQVWNGEQVQLKSSYIGSTYKKEFSTSRTITLAAAAAAGFYWIASHSLIASGTEDTNNGGGTTNASRRLPFRR